MNRNLGRARFTELADMGLIEEVERRPCNVTGRRAIVWSFVVGPPRPREKSSKAMELAQKQTAREIAAWLTQNSEHLSDELRKALNEAAEQIIEIWVEPLK